MNVDYVEHYGTDLSVVNAARVSFANESEWELVKWDEVIDPDSRIVEQHPGWRLSDKDVKLVHYLAKNKHTSCFEHQGATLRLKVPIFIARQIQRHRTFSYNEVSRRYVDTPPEFFWPDVWRTKADNVKQGSGDTPADLCPSVQRSLDDFILNADYVYNILLESGVAPELARMTLPQNMYTEFYMTGSLRNFSHLLKLRLDSHSQVEAQQVAQMIYDILQPLWPVSMEALMKYD